MFKGTRQFPTVFSSIHHMLICIGFVGNSVSSPDSVNY